MFGGGFVKNSLVEKIFKLETLKSLKKGCGKIFKLRGRLKDKNGKQKGERRHIIINIVIKEKS